MSPIAFVIDQVAIGRILDHLGLSTPEADKPPPAVPEILRVAEHGDGWGVPGPVGVSWSRPGERFAWSQHSDTVCPSRRAPAVAARDGAGDVPAGGRAVYVRVGTSGAQAAMAHAEVRLDVVTVRLSSPEQTAAAVTTAPGHAQQR